MHRVWLITGASSGIGRSLVAQVLRAGDTVVATFRSPGEVASFERSGHGRAIGALADVRSTAEVAVAVERGAERASGLDVVVNAAGYAVVGAVEELSDGELLDQIEVNLFGTHRVTRAALPLLRARRSGCIVNFGSAAGSAGPAGLGAYEASKAAVDRLSAALRAEVSSFGIRVIVVAPGGVRTEWAGSSLRHVARWLPAYDRTVGQTRKRLGDVNGHQDGDPDVVATVIREAVTSPNPPSRLLIGVDAHRSSSAQLHQEAADLMRWRPSTAGPSTDP